MNRSTRVVLLSSVFLAVGCGDNTPTQPEPPGPQVAEPAYPIETGPIGTGQTNGNADAIEIPAPAVGVGDVLIAQVVVARLNGPGMAAAADVICAPAGWSSIRRTNNRPQDEVSDVSQETFVFVASAAAPATAYQWNFRSGACSGSSVSKSASGAIALFTGVNRSQPVDAHEGDTGTIATELATPNVTTTVHGAHVLRFVGASGTTQVTFNGIATVTASSSGEYPTTAASGVFSQSLAGATDAGWFQFGLEGASGWVGQTIALRPLHESEILIHDRFSRDNGNGWGTAEVGSVWSVNSPPQFLVGGGEGLVDAVGDSTVYIGVARAPAAYGLNVAGLTSFSVNQPPDGGAGRFHTVQVYARRNDQTTRGDNYYRYRVRLFGGAKGFMDVRIEKTVNAVPAFVTDSVKLTTTFSPGDKYWLRWEALGTSPTTTVRMRVWKNGEPEPTEWHASAVVDEPGLDYPGTSGYRFQTPTVQLNWPVRFAVDDFLYVQRAGPR